MADPVQNIDELIKNLLGAGLITPQQAGGTVGLEALRQVANQNVASTQRDITTATNRKNILTERIPRTIGENFASRGIQGGVAQREQNQQLQLALDPLNNQLSGLNTDLSNQTNVVNNLAQLGDYFKNIGNLTLNNKTQTSSPTRASQNSTNPFIIGSSGGTNSGSNQFLTIGQRTGKGVNVQSQVSNSPLSQQLLAEHNISGRGQAIPDINLQFGTPQNFQSLADLQAKILNFTKSPYDVNKHFASLGA